MVNGKSAINKPQLTPIIKTSSLCCPILSCSDLCRCFRSGRSIWAVQSDNCTRNPKDLWEWNLWGSALQERPGHHTLQCKRASQRGPWTVRPCVICARVCVCVSACHMCLLCMRMSLRSTSYVHPQASSAVIHLCAASFVYKSQSSPWCTQLWRLMKGQHVHVVVISIFQMVRADLTRCSVYYNCSTGHTLYLCAK